MSTPERCREEARKLLDLLEGYDNLMNSKDLGFYEGMVEAFDEYGDRTRVTDRQVWWLRDLKDRYAL